MKLTDAITLNTEKPKMKPSDAITLNTEKRKMNAGDVTEKTPRYRGTFV